MAAGSGEAAGEGAARGGAVRRGAAPAPSELDADLPIRHVTSTRVIAVRGNELEVRDDLVAGEEPLEIRAAGPRQAPVQVAVTMRTPGHEAELALGFLTSEGLLAGNEVTGVEYGDPGVVAEPDDSVLVRLARRFDPSRVAKRNFVATASCGICGKASIDDVAIRCEPLPRGLPVVARSVITSLPDSLRLSQAAFERTGGLHAAGLFATDGSLIAIREDVGRHNALDKLIGSRVRAHELPLWDRVLMVSGRVSFEIVQKAAVAGLPIICAVSAPSDLAVRLADRLGVTLVGFLRGDGFNVYSHDGRVDLRDLLGL
jgi:FdhD protein